MSRYHFTLSDDLVLWCSGALKKRTLGTDQSPQKIYAWSNYGFTYSKTPIYRVPRFTGPNLLPPIFFSVKFHWITRSCVKGRDHLNVTLVSRSL